MSHGSKLALLASAHAAGFKNYLYFIATEAPDINVRRVAQRVQKGGHNVDTQKIRERYYRALELLPDMIPYCHRCYLIDNSLEGKYRLIAEIEDNESLFTYSDQNIPQWVLSTILNIGFA